LERLNIEFTEKGVLLMEKTSLLLLLSNENIELFAFKKHLLWRCKTLKLLNIQESENQNRRFWDFIET
jgi:hypothetical protein